MASPSSTHERTGGFDRRRDLGKARREIVAVARVEPNASGLAPGENAETVVLDFVNPIWTRRRLFRRTGQARQAGFRRWAPWQHGSDTSWYAGHRALFKGKDALPVVLHADDGPA